MTENQELTKEKMNHILLSDYAWLHEVGKDGKLSWDSSMADLCIWVHQLFLQFAITDKHGNARKFKSLVQEICALTNRIAPHNPNSYINNSQKEDSAWSKTFITRYKEIFLSGEPHPIRHFLSRKKDGQHFTGAIPIYDGTGIYSFAVFLPEMITRYSQQKHNFHPLQSFGKRLFSIILYMIKEIYLPDIKV